ncbi:outer membrane protein assembly factor BamB family protein [Streptomyces sp. DSM 40750]|uniref:outer membrane protein assembly factor BamB family protein n=1 Tax=Streptomyces sp. DSM 40750 TaxID=2801030 RepID=UPI00214ACF81|nr:PQQ-binding-like beta-propeller repeat protein [Streptomyces sp. DSM 40750]UUU19283.1 PQQ-binding-like beta-propeller repeat protein [Streptomyces sp. DSM 40750]UUU27373.1 PQQ-binding-like beta-propeller repeat protein [Streptomyces sp. DSM 40750]
MLVNSPARTYTGRTGTDQAWQVKWTRETGGPLLSPPMLMDGLLVVTCGSTAHLIDATTGGHERSLALRGTAESAPVPWDDRLWWALRDGGLNGYDLRGLTDETHLELDGDPGRHSPVTVNDLLLIGTTHGLFWFQHPRTTDSRAAHRLIWLDEPVVSPLATDGVQVWVPTERRGLMAVRPATGEIRSPHQAWDAAGCTPTPTTDGVYIGDALGTVHHLDPEGTSRRQWDASTFPITAPPVTYGDLLLVTDHAGAVIALSMEQWDQKWRAVTDGDGRRAVTALDGVVYVCGARSVRRLDARTGRELKPLTPDGPRPMNVTATPGRLHVSFVDGLLNTWGPPG